MLQELNFNIFNVFILAGIIHGVIFCLIIFINKKLNSKTNFFLAYTILSLVLSNLQYWFIDTGIIPRSRYDNNDLIFIPFEFLMLPFFFLFVKSYLGKQIGKYEKVYLFIPFLLSVIYLFIDDVFKINLRIVKVLNLIVEYISIVFSIAIIILVFRTLIGYEKKYSKYKAFNVAIKTKWLKRILYIGLFLCFLWVISLNLLEKYFSEGYYKYYALWIGITILIYWIGYLGVFHSDVFLQRQQIRTDNLTSFNPTSKIKPNLNITRFEEIESYIENNKMYLNPNISLDVLSSQIGLSNGYISQLVNEFANTNFSSYINHLRIEESKKMLLNKEYRNYTIVAIALEAGFNSKSAFYNAFKRETGISPNEYKQKNLS